MNRMSKLSRIPLRLAKKMVRKVPAGVHPRLVYHQSPQLQLLLQPLQLLLLHRLLPSGLIGITFLITRSRYAVSMMKAKVMISLSTCYQFEDPTFGTTGSSLSSITPYSIYSSRSGSLILDEFDRIASGENERFSWTRSEISVCSSSSYHQ